MAFGDIPVFMKALRGKSGVEYRALEFTILNWARTNETLGAKWSEINLSERTWTVPPERSKTGEEHVKPLCDRSVAILKSVPRQTNSDHIFIGAKPMRGLGHSAMLDALYTLRDDATVHGFRSTAKDWASETTSHANTVTEMQLGHIIASDVERAYRRGALIAKRRALIADRSKFCALKPARRPAS